MTGGDGARSSGGGPAVRVAVLEDHELLAESLRLALNAHGFAVDVPALRERETLLAHLADPVPDVVLLDLDLGPPLGDGSTLVSALADGGARVVVVSGTEDRTRIAGCIELGACGFVAKTAPLDELVTAVRAAVAGEQLLDHATRFELLADLRAHRARQRERSAPFDALTAREQFVLGRLVDGRSAAEIATEAVVSEATVRSHIRAVLTKLGVNSQLAAVARARQAGWRAQP